MIDLIQWLGHASFKISGDKLIYIDPWKIQEEEKADIILVSHLDSSQLKLVTVLDEWPTIREAWEGVISLLSRFFID